MWLWRRSAVGIQNISILVPKTNGIRGEMSFAKYCPRVEGFCHREAGRRDQRIANTRAGTACAHKKSLEAQGLIRVEDRIAGHTQLLRQTARRGNHTSCVYLPADNCLSQLIIDLTAQRNRGLTVHTKFRTNSTQTLQSGTVVFKSGSLQTRMLAGR